jgi:hypothetical protein
MNASVSIANPCCRDVFDPHAQGCLLVPDCLIAMTAPVYQQNFAGSPLTNAIPLLQAFNQGALTGRL